jgi:protein involved in polysaccharide export with SLBB domain
MLCFASCLTREGYCSIGGGLHSHVNQRGAGEGSAVMRLLLAIVISLALGGAAWAQGPESAPGAPPTSEFGVGGITYVLGSGDKVRITVFGEDTLSGEYLVPGEGNIAFPLIGGVRASGLTVDQLQKEIETKLRAGYLKDPRVSIEVLNYRPFYILGEVMKPGEYPYTNGLTVLNAVATANGFTYRADTRKVYIRRANGPNEVQYPLKTTTPVAPGDTIRIGERFF